MNEHIGRVVVADIGGTNARCAIATLDGSRVTLERLEVRASTGYSSLAALIAEYLRSISSPPEYASLALAGPVRNGVAHATNIGWDVDETSLARELRLARVFLLNDFAALARAIPSLEPENLIAVKDGDAAPEGPISIMGAGTGFGAALLARCEDGYSLIATESGHASFAPSDALEMRLWEYLRADAAHVSIEMLLSGTGLSTIYAALYAFRGQKRHRSPEDICRRAAENPNSVSAEALRLFCDIFGATAGNIALTQGATGGVYLAGGVLMKNHDSLRQSNFAARFAAKGVMSPYVAKIPVKLIRSERAALRGAALWFADAMKRL
jgi:glucokinase